MAVGSIVPVSKRSTLYPAVEPESAPAKYRHGATITPPGTLIAYRLAVDDVINFARGYDPTNWSED